MSDTGQSSKTIAILVAIVVVTIALLGAEAWNQSHRGMKSSTVPAAAVTPSQTQAPVAPRRVVKQGQDHGTKDDHGEVMMNE